MSLGSLLAGQGTPGVTLLSSISGVLAVGRGRAPERRDRQLLSQLCTSSPGLGPLP